MSNLVVIPVSYVNCPAANVAEIYALELGPRLDRLGVSTFTARTRGSC